jgi:dienelactone hydrolase
MAHASRSRRIVVSASLPVASSLAWLACAAIAAAQSGPPVPPASPVVQLLDDHGAVESQFEVGDTLWVRVDGLTPLAAYDLVLRDDHDVVLGFARGAAEKDGSMGPEVLWWESGITGPDPAGTGRAGDGFQKLSDAEQFLAAHAIKVEVRSSDVSRPSHGKLVTTFNVPVLATRQTPFFYFSDSRGNLRNSFEAGQESMLVTGERLPAGATVDLYVVGDRDGWEVGDDLVDVTGNGGSASHKRVGLATSATSFTVPVWPAVWQRPGSFDVVARVNDPARVPKAQYQLGDYVGHDSESGVHVRSSSTTPRAATPTDVEAPLSGRRTNNKSFPKLRYQNVFSRHDKIAVGLDPGDVPSNLPGGKYAEIWVSPARSAAQWHANPGLGDVTEVVDVKMMKAGTLEATVTTAWIDADPRPGLDKFDVVLDFYDVIPFDPDPLLNGATTGRPKGGGKPIFNHQYDVGVDVIDHLDGDGFHVLDDPSETGPYPVGRTSYDFVDAYDIPWGQYQDQNVDVTAVVAYPGQSAGTDVPVYGTTEKFPLIVIMHGNHNVCTNLACTCAKSKRIPNDEGYDYLLDLWASHGFIAVSIDAYDITGCPADRFIERGALFQEHMVYWENWNDPTIADPTFSGRYYNRVDVDKIGICGHSRGGEGAAACVQINQDLALGHQIKAAMTIAPTDYNWFAPPGGGPTEFVVADVPLLNMMGSSDGDVSDMEGAQLWDRAEPAGRRACKSQVFIYGADHNAWNTVWVDPAWAGSGDDGVGSDRITFQQQQDCASVFITSWWKAWLQGEQDYLAFHRGAITSPKLTGINLYWSYEPADRLDVDHFEDMPVDKTLNSLGGSNVVNPTPVKWLESGMRPGDYDNSFYQDTDGLIFSWNTITTYEVDVPAGFQDVSSYAAISLRATQIWDNHKKNKGGNLNFYVNLEDGNGRRQAVDVDSAGYYDVPEGYNSPIGGHKSMLSTVRVPLKAFTVDQSGVDLTQITKIILTFKKTGLVGIDDIQFTK